MNASSLKTPPTSRLVINGDRPLSGEVQVQGMKNAATPIIAATLLVSGECVIDRVPRLSDVERMLDILRSLGARVEWTGDNQLTIDTRSASLDSLDEKMVKSMRSSVLLMGPLLSRFKQVDLPEPGGCIIGNRPLDTHLTALEALGAEISSDDGVYSLRAGQLRGAKFVLPEQSVTGTENAVMAAVLAEGQSVIKLCAAEPHVQDLCNFLNKCGARISGIGSNTLTIDGVSELAGTTHEIIPDQIEAGTWMVIGAVTKGTLTITGLTPDHLDIVLLLLKQAGVHFEINGDRMTISSQSSLKAFRLKALPYPNFPTDLQAPFGVLATQCSGTSLVHDPLFEGRLGYINELIKMGANAVICDPHRVLISGPTPLYGQEIRGLDLRAGASLVIAGLVAKGQTVLHGAQIIDRGYQDLDDRLRALGADLTREVV
jgi:UDP-N-acetylglucosamine 1-carboxyvinyltransferase